MGLEHQGVAIPVRDQPGPSVALAVKASISGGIRAKYSGTALPGGLEPGAPKGVVDRGGRSRVENPDPERGIGVQQADGQEPVPPIEDHAKIARGTFPVLVPDRIRIDPRMPGTNGAFGGWGDANVGGDAGIPGPTRDEHARGMPKRESFREEMGAKLPCRCRRPN